MLADTIQEICALPAAFRAEGLSFRELAGRTRFSEHRSQVTEDALADFLRSHPDYVELWLAWSEDKRTSSGPFFQKVGARFELGSVEHDGKLGRSRFFTDPARGCAAFILQELAV